MATTVAVGSSKGKIAIVGATGSTGLQLVKQALARGYKVVAPVRNPSKLANISHNNLEV